MLKAIPLWLRLGFLLVVAVSALLIWQVPQRRASKVLERSEAAIAQREFETAENELKSLLARHPGQTKAALRLADILRASDSNAAFSLLYELHQAGRLPSDRYPDATILGFEMRRMTEANELVLVMEEHVQSTPRLIGVRAVKALIDGDLNSAKKQLEETLALFPEWETVRYIEGQLLRRSPSKVDQLRAKEDLRTVAESSGFDGLRALFSLVDSDNLLFAAEEKQTFLDRVIDHPWANPRLRLLAYHYRWQLDPTGREEDIEAATKDLGDSHPIMLAEWMNAIGEHDRALLLIPEGTLAKTNVKAFEQRFRALALGGRFKDAETLVMSSEVGETAVQQAARLFLLALRPDNSDEAVDRWNEAFALARSGNDQGVQYFLGRSALRLGYLTGAIQAYRGLFADESFSAAAAESVWTEYFTVTLATGSMEEAHAVLNLALDRFPDSVALLNNRLYIELVAGMEWADTYARFTELAPPPAEVKDVNGIGSTWVLSELLRDNPRQALEYLTIIEERNPDQAINDSTKIIKALVLAANNHLSEAVRLSEGIDREKVLPAEWSLLGNLRLDP